MFLKNYGFQSEVSTDLSKVIKIFEVTHSYEGPQILLKWEFVDNSQIAEFKIMKKEGAYPLSVNDGILVVVNDSSWAHGDLAVNAGTIYYYTLFVRLEGETEFVFDTISMGKALALATGYYQDALWRLIPQVYRLQDVVGETLQTMQVS